MGGACVVEEPPAGWPMIFRLSLKLAQKLKVKTLATVPLAENPFADWTANLFEMSRREHIIVANTRTFYCVILPGDEASDLSEFLNQALRSLCASLGDDGLGFLQPHLKVPALADVQFAKAADRRVTGSMVELVKIAKSSPENPSYMLPQLGHGLNGIIMSSLDFRGDGSWGTPLQAFKELANAAR